MATPVQWTFIRHGESIANAQRKVSGWWDVALTQTGRQQALSAGRQLANLRVDRVLSSDLMRASETANIAMSARAAILDEYPPPKIIISPLLRERNFGKMEGANIDLLRHDGRIQDLIQWDRCPQDAETMAGFSARVIRVLQQQNDSSATVVFAHGGVLRVILGFLEQTPLNQLGLRKIDNAKPYTVTLTDAHKALLSKPVWLK